MLKETHTHTHTRLFAYQYVRVYIHIFNGFCEEPLPTTLSSSRSWVEGPIDIHARISKNFPRCLQHTESSSHNAYVYTYIEISIYIYIYVCIHILSDSTTKVSLKCSKV